MMGFDYCSLFELSHTFNDDGKMYFTSSFANSVLMGNSNEVGFIQVLKENKFRNVKIFHKTDFQVFANCHPDALVGI